MMNLKPYFAGIISVFFLLVITGCQSIDVRGQFVSDSAIEQINIKKPNQGRVGEYDWNTNICARLFFKHLVLYSKVTSSQGLV